MSKSDSHFFYAKEAAAAFIGNPDSGSACFTVEACGIRIDCRVVEVLAYESAPTLLSIVAVSVDDEGTRVEITPDSHLLTDGTVYSATVNVTRNGADMLIDAEACFSRTR